MGGAYTLALVGFADSESATFESFFRLAARRPPAYRVQDEVMDAQILLVNADNMQALHLVQYAELPGKVLLVGNSDGGTGWPLQRKPVRLVSVLAALDTLVGVAPKTSAPVPTPAQPPVSPRQGADRGFAATEPHQSSQMPMVPMVPAAPRRRRTSDTEFPATRPMVRSVLATTPVPTLPSAAMSAAPGRSQASSHRSPQGEGTPVSAAPGRSPASSHRSPQGEGTPVSAAPGRSPASSHRSPQGEGTPVSARAARPGVMGLTDFGGLEELPVLPPNRAPRSTRSPTQASVPVVQRGDMLLVAESLVEGRILHKRFKKYGLAIDWSRDATQALVMLKAHPYRLVAIDRLGGEPDAYQVCRSAKQHKLPNGQSPVVVMFAPSAGSMDRIKAGLAGSDAYLSRSVAEAEFYKVLTKHRLVDLDGFEKTNIGF